MLIAEASFNFEVARLIVESATPIVIAVLGVYLSFVARRFDHATWRNQRLIDKRISIYDDLAPDLNDLLCYFTFVGCWKDLTPRDVVAMKRRVDKKIYIAAPLFSPQFLNTASRFMTLCFAQFAEWGHDAKLKTPTQRRREAAGQKWDPAWDQHFADQFSDPQEIQRAYEEVMKALADDIGLSKALAPLTGGIPADIR